MRKLTYFAIFEPTETGYGVMFPDFMGCISVGDNFEHAIKMAKEALSLHFWGMEKDNDEIPAPTFPPYEDMEPGDIVVPIEIFPDMFREHMDNKAIKKTLTLPAWLNERAEAEGVNFSQLLQHSLKEHLGIAN